MPPPPPANATPPPLANATHLYSNAEAAAPPPPAASGVALVGLVVFVALAAVQLINLCSRAEWGAALRRDHQLVLACLALATFYLHAVLSPDVNAALISLEHWIATWVAATLLLYQHCRTFGFKRRRFMRWAFLLGGGLACAGAAHGPGGTAAPADTGILYIFGLLWLFLLAWSITLAFVRTPRGRQSSMRDAGLELPCTCCERRDRAALFALAPLLAAFAAALGPTGAGALSSHSEAAVVLGAELTMAGVAAENAWTDLRGDLLSDSDDDL